MFEKIYFASDIGRKRKINEDSCYASQLKVPHSELKYMLIVADGMGGHEKGEKASAMVVDFFKNLFVKGEYINFAKKNEIVEKNQIKYFSSILENSFFYLNNKIRQMQGEGVMGTTLTMALIFHGKKTGREVLIGHVGDSRAYVYHNSKLKQVTEDDSLVWELYKAGKIKRSQLETHKNKNVILKAINGERFDSIQIKHFPFPKESLLLLCSDGLSGMISDSKIKNVIQSVKTIEDLGEKLIEEANSAGGKDNISVALYTYELFDIVTQKKRERKKKTLIFSIVFLLLALGISGIYLLKDDLSTVKGKISQTIKNEITKQKGKNESQKSFSKQENVSDNIQSSKPTITHESKTTLPKGQSKISWELENVKGTYKVEFTFNDGSKWGPKQHKKYQLKNIIKKEVPKWSISINDKKYRLTKTVIFPDPGDKEIALTVYDEQDYELASDTTSIKVQQIKIRGSHNKLTPNDFICIKNDIGYDVKLQNRKFNILHSDDGKILPSDDGKVSGAEIINIKNNKITVTYRSIKGKNDKKEIPLNLDSLSKR